MEIKNSLNRLDPYLNRVDLGKASLSKESHSAQAAAHGDVVNISSAALKSIVVEEAMRTPEVRQDKVDEIKARLVSGEYEIDGMDIAAKLLQTESDLV